MLNAPLWVLLHRRRLDRARKLKRRARELRGKLRRRFFRTAADLEQRWVERGDA